MKLTEDQIITRVDSLEADRGVWRTHWQELYDYILPRKNDVVKKQVAGTKKGVQLFDNTAMVACEILAGALHGMLTNPNQVWFELQTSDPELRKSESVKEYLQGLTQRMHDILNRSNFQTEVHELYLDLCSIGTAVMIVEEDDETVVNFGTRFIDEVRIVENSRGRVEEVHRVWKWSAARILEEYGKGINLTDDDAVGEKFGDQVARAYKAGDTHKFEMINSIYREELHPKQKPTFPFISQHLIKETKKIVKEGGFRTFPYLTPRWTKVAGETYGRSPGMNALPEAKSLNLMARTVLKGAQKTVDPPLQAPDDGFSTLKRTVPGSIHYYRAGSKDRIEPIYNDARVDFGIQVSRDSQQHVKEAFFVDRLNLAENDRMTQMEVNQRIEEQFRFLGPMLGRQQSEFLRPLITRVLDIMVRKDRAGDLMGDVPEELGDVELDVIYTSPIARTQRVDQGQALLRAFEASRAVMELSPETLDLVDSDAFLKHNWDIFGAPQSVLRKEDEVEQIREARQEAQKQAIENNQNQQDAELASNLPQQG